LSYTVSRREREIGIRIAIGARPAQAAWGIVRQMTLFTGIGVAAGLAAALSLTGSAETLLYGVKPDDPVSLLAAAGVMAGLALVAGWLPARRAASIPPAVAFRSE
jgi:ABC-type antimicrobial peptide transport system permease subunit